MIKRGMKVKWANKYAWASKRDHVFKGKVVRVIDDRAIVDDGSGRSYRIIPVSDLVEDRT